MADDEQLRANLELPKLFGRKRQRAAEPEADSAPEPVTEPPTVAEPPPQDPEAEVVATPGPDQPEQLSDAPMSPASPDPEPTAEAVEPEPTAEAPIPEPEPEPEPAETTPRTDSDAEHADEAEVAQPETPRPPRTPLSQRLSAAASGFVDRGNRALDALESLPRPKLPGLAGYQAAAVTGAVIGLLLVALTAGTIKTCGVVRGADTCGRSGFLLLAAIFVLMVIASSALLRAWQVREPGSTALLAVGMVAVIALLFMIDLLFSWWVVLLIPLASAGSFMLSFWVTDNFADAEAVDDEQLDVR